MGRIQNEQRKYEVQKEIK